MKKSDPADSNARLEVPKLKAAEIRLFGIDFGVHTTTALLAPSRNRSNGSRTAAPRRSIVRPSVETDRS